MSSGLVDNTILLCMEMASFLLCSSKISPSSSTMIKIVSRSVVCAARWWITLIYMFLISKIMHKRAGSGRLTGGYGLWATGGSAGRAEV